MSTDPRPDEKTVTLSAPATPPSTTPTETLEGEAPWQAPASPLELVSQRFPRTLFGYRTQDVDEYLLHLAREWEEMVLPSRTVMSVLSTAVERAGGQRPYESVGEEVGRVLSEAYAVAEEVRLAGTEQYETAVQAAEKMLSDATAERDRLLAEARSQRDRILADANAEREKLLADAATQKEEILQAANRERDSLRASSAEIRSRLAGIVDNVAPLLEESPDVPAPVGREEAPEVTTTIEILPEPAEEIPESQKSTGIPFLEEAMRSKPRSGAAKRSRR